ELNGSELPRSFNIVTNDILMSKLSYKLMKKSIQENTHHVFNFNYDNAATCMLRSDDIDLYIGEDKNLSPEVKIRTIGHSECVFIAKKDHPVLQMEKSLKELKEYILIVSKNKLKEEMESLYRERGYKRKIHGVSAGYLPMVENVIQTDSLGVVPLYVVEVLQRMNIEVDFFRPEFELPKVRIIQAWHPRYHNCSSHKWLRDISKDLLEF
ncbi:LysR substrate-binding domain-containing protein, partial [Mixta sp.]